MSAVLPVLLTLAVPAVCGTAAQARAGAGRTVTDPGGTAHNAPVPADIVTARATVTAG